ncbi:MAG TPA: histidine phosphatase family protein [Gaiellaceae bacterium]|nr:histidine phosphatase family protein [Gaiellaceae bacterium]
MPAALALVRHGETDWNRERRFQGHADVGLNARGRAAARALARAFAGDHVTALVASPLRRALETALVLGAGLGLEPVADERLQEIDVGSWQGLTREEVQARDAAAYGRWLAGEAGWEGGETYDALAARVLPALYELAGSCSHGVVVVVTHGGPIRVALRAAGVPPDALGPVANCAILRLVSRDGNLEPVD